jgi:hypothetical protein
MGRVDAFPSAREKVSLAGSTLRSSVLKCALELDDRRKYVITVAAVIHA